MKLQNVFRSFLQSRPRCGSTAPSTSISTSSRRTSYHTRGSTFPWQPFNPSFQLKRYVRYLQILSHIQSRFLVMISRGPEITLRVKSRQYWLSTFFLNAFKLHNFNIWGGRNTFVQSIMPKLGLTLNTKGIIPNNDYRY